MRSVISSFSQTFWFKMYTLNDQFLNYVDRGAIPVPSVLNHYLYKQLKLNCFLKHNIGESRLGIPYNSDSGLSNL